MGQEKSSERKKAKGGKGNGGVLKGQEQQHGTEGMELWEVGSED